MKIKYKKVLIKRKRKNILFKFILASLLSLFALFILVQATITLSQTSSFNTNTTLEGNNFTHLNVSNKSIVGYWSFDENYNTNLTFDYTNNSNDGSLQNGVTFNSSCIYGNCYTFDGVDDYIHFGAPASLNTASTTWSVWVNFPSEKSASLINKNNYITAGNYFTLWVGEATSSLTNELITIMRNSGNVRAGYVTATRTELFDGNWHHIVMTADGSSYKLYLDGVSKTLTVGQGANDGKTAITGYNVFAVGAFTSTSNSSFINGTIDEVMVWDVALNATHVQELYRNQTSRFLHEGEVEFRNLDFGGNNTVNITLTNCQANQGSYLQGRINTGNYQNFSNCLIKDYNVTGTLSNANLTIKFIAGNSTNPFYSPIIIGNITLESRSGLGDTTAPNITISIPTNNSFSSSSSQDINFTVQDANLNTCWYSNDTMTINTTLANCNINITTLNFADGQHNFTIWVNDTSNNVNFSMVTFTVDTLFPQLNITHPFNNSILTGINHTLNFTFTEINRDTCYYQIRNITNSINVENSTLSSCQNTTFEVSDTGMNYTLFLYINDSANNLNFTAVYFSIPQPRAETGTGGGGNLGNQGGGGSGTPNNTLICTYSEIFLKEHLTKENTYNYSYEEIVNLTNLYNFNENAVINPTTFEYYLNSFPISCNKAYPSFFQPLPEKNITFVRIFNNETICDHNLNRKLEFVFPFRWKYDLDNSMPFFTFRNKMTCEQLKFWRWIFKFEEVVKPEYKIVGLKWWWGFPTFIFLGYIFIRGFKKKKIKQYRAVKEDYFGFK